MYAAARDTITIVVAAAAIAWLLVPLAERLAFRVGAIDVPKERGLHDKPMPRLSGLAILVAVEVAGWSWSEPGSPFRGRPAAVATVRFARGTVASYRGSWVSRGPATPFGSPGSTACCWRSSPSRAPPRTPATELRFGAVHVPTCTTAV